MYVSPVEDTLAFVIPWDCWRTIYLFSSIIPDFEGLTSSRVISRLSTFRHSQMAQSDLVFNWSNQGDLSSSNVCRELIQ